MPRLPKSPRWGWVIGFFLFAGCQTASVSPPADLAILGVTVIDSAHGVRAGQDVRVGGGSVLSVSRAGDSAPRALRVIDGRGKFLIPGLWDMHVHTTYDPEITSVLPELFLSYGITSVRDTGGLLDELEPVISSWRAAEAVAPRVFYSGPLLDGTKVVYDGVGRPEIGIANPSGAAARANVARLQRAGVDFVKIYELVSPEVFAVLVAAARDAGLPIAAHVPLAVPAEQAGPQVDSMEHLRNIELACSGSAREQLQERRARLEKPGDLSGYDLRRSLHGAHHGRAREAFDEATCDKVLAALGETIQVPTLRLNTVISHPPYERSDWQEHLKHLPEAARLRWSTRATEFSKVAGSLDPALARWSLELVGRLYRAGVPLGAGTDTPIGLALPGYSLHTELERLVEAGLTPLEALEAATLQPARFFDLQDSMGQIQKGHVADLVLLEANPLDDIRNTRRIYRVISRGQVIERD